MAVGAFALLGGGLAATQATGDSPVPPTRSEALLAATQTELLRTERSVDAIALQHVVDGREVYAVTGPETACILVARVDQALGRSEALTCSNTAFADRQRPMQTGFDTASGAGYVDLVWVGGAAPAQVSASGSPASVELGAEVISAKRNDDTAAGSLKWQGPAAAPVEVELPSRADRIEQATVEVE